MEIENTMTAQTSAASEGNADAGNGNAGVTEKNGSEQAVHAEFSDSDSEEQSAAEQKANARNRENARRRREGEQRRAQELQRERQEAREAAILEILDGQNPYTGEPMKDSRDIEEYLIMKEIDRQGGDPERDFAKFQKAKEREREKLATEGGVVPTGPRRFCCQVPRRGSGRIDRGGGLYPVCRGQDGEKAVIGDL